MKRGLTISFLEEIADTLEILNSENFSPIFNPSIAIFSAIIMASTVSFDKGVILPLFLILVSIIMILYLKINLKFWVKPVFFTLLVTTVISMPLIFISKNNFLLKPMFLEMEEILSLILRATAASAIFTTLIIHIGWTGLLEGLHDLRLPEEFVFLIGFSIKYIPIFLRDTCKLIAAKESRMLKGLKYSTAWSNMSAVAGEIFLRSYEKNLKLNLALTARTFYNSSSTSFKHPISVRDVLLLALTALIVIAAVVL